MNRGMQMLAALAFIALAATLTARLTGYTTGVPEPSELEASRNLVFADLGDGMIQVFDADDQSLLLEIGSGEEVFLRTVIRGLAQQRQLISEDRNAPFLLSRFADGRLVVSDQVTGQRIELNAFGPDNAKAFEKLLSGGRPPIRASAHAISESVSTPAPQLSAAATPLDG